jgi:hypothetical protein
MHSFGCFTGEANQWKGNMKQNPQTEIGGHIHVFQDVVGIFKTHEKKNQSKSLKEDYELGTDYRDLHENHHAPPRSQKSNEFSDMIIMYPVGRHIAFRSLETSRMKFIQLPNHVHTVQCIALNNK